MDQQATELAFEYPHIDTATHARHHRRNEGALPGLHADKRSKQMATIGFALDAQTAGLDEYGLALDAALRGAPFKKVVRTLELEHAEAELQASMDPNGPNALP